MVKRKQKKVVKQKQKQNVNVKQNVKVVIGDVRKKRAVKSSGAKSAKPPIILNISNPQPNNMFMEYFRKQLQNQEPIKANTLNEQVKIKEKQETEASKAGALGKLVQEPDDVAREMRRQRVAGIERFQVAQSQRKEEVQQIRSSLKPVKQDDPRVAKTPLRPRIQTPKEHLMASIRAVVPETPASANSEMLAQLRQRQNSIESAMNKAGDKEDEEDDSESIGLAGAGAGGAGAGAAGEDDTKTEIGDWNTNDESPLSELDALWGKPTFKIIEALNKKKLPELRLYARELNVPWSKGGKALNKPDVIVNIERAIRNGTPQARPGRPKIIRSQSNKV